MIQFPFDQLCFYAIVVKNGNLESIANILDVVELEHLYWNDADDFRYYESTLNREKRVYDCYFITHAIMGWNYILFDNLLGLNEIFNHCNQLSKVYDEIFAFMNDAHCGYYMFLKIKDKSIVRFFEDNDRVRSEFGDLLEEEKDIDRTNGFLAIEVAANVLKLKEDITDVSSLKRKIGVGKKYKPTQKQDVTQLVFDFDKNDVEIDLTNFRHDLPF